MSDAPHVTVQVGLAQQLSEFARANQELRAQLAEKEKTNRLLVERIAALQQEVARLEHHG